MNLIERKEKEARLAKLKARNNELKELIKAENALEPLEEMDKEKADNKAEIIQLENELSEAEQEKEKENKTMNYLETNNSVKDFMDAVKNNAKGEAIVKAWKGKLAENGVTITDDNLQLPKKIVTAIETTLLEANPVFKVFKLTHVGALLVTQTFGSTDEALIHTPGAQKQIQNATLEIDNLKPVMVYKLQSIHEYVKRLNANYDEIYDLIVREMTQAIVNKVVDLALIEGKEADNNGFISIMEETDAEKVLKITATAGDTAFSDAVEVAVDFVRGKAGRKYLVITAAQRSALLKELRALLPNVRLRNSDSEIAAELGIDELIVYTGTKEIKPMVIVQDAYQIDMEDLTKVDAFKWETNENAILLEGLAVGRMIAIKGGAVITLP